MLPFFDSELPKPALLGPGFRCAARMLLVGRGGTQPPSIMNFAIAGAPNNPDDS